MLQEIRDRKEVSRRLLACDWSIMAGPIGPRSAGKHERKSVIRDDRAQPASLFFESAEKLATRRLCRPTSAGKRSSRLRSLSSSVGSTAHSAPGVYTTGTSQLHHAIQLLQWHDVWLQNEDQLGSKPPDWTPPSSILVTASRILAGATETNVDDLLKDISAKLACATLHAEKEEPSVSSWPDAEFEPVVFELEVIDQPNERLGNCPAVP